MDKKIIFLIIMLLLGITATASARDLPRSDPARKAILDTVRSSPKIKFVVKDLYRSGDFAWLCAVESKNGVLHSDELGLFVLKYVLLLDHGKWIAESAGEGAGNVECGSELIYGSPPAELPASEEDLKAIWKAVIHQALLDDLKWGHWGKSLDDGVRNMISILKAHGIEEDFVIEHPKEKLDKMQFDIATEQCKDARCKKAMTQAAADLPRLRDDSRVSSLVWDNCQYGLRINRTDVIANCVDTHMFKPYCRPGMHYFQDKKDIQHCLGDILQQCRSLPFADDVTRYTVCFMSN
ncbi:MAG: hypothetical protein PHT88_05685 [Candidatus Moranbacteria bacterium]|nr:hypothetical protein [Candidatus Moranbacteria bacterium]